MSVAPLLVPVYPLPEESVIAFWSSSFHQAWGEKDILVSGVPKLNRVETCEADKAELYIAKLDISPSKYLNKAPPVVYPAPINKFLELCGSVKFSSPNAVFKVWETPSTYILLLPVPALTITRWCQLPSVKFAAFPVVEYMPLFTPPGL